MTTDRFPAEAQNKPIRIYRARHLLYHVGARPDDPSVSRLLAEAMRAGPCVPALASLSRVDLSAALAAADMLLTLLI
jgi:hypothetical protein